MQPRRIVVLGRLESGGTDPVTLRPLPDRLVDIVQTMGEFDSVGSIVQQQVANISLQTQRQKVILRTNFFREHNYIYSTDRAGQPALYRILNTQQVVGGGQQNKNLISLVVVKDNEQRIIDAFEQAIGGV